MSPLDALLELCEQWRLLSEREGESIHAADWNSVAGCQAEKKAMQGEISAAAEALRRETGWKGARQNEMEGRLGAMARRLLALEQRNRQTLRARQEAARGKSTELQKTLRNLQRLHRAYGAESQPIWHSFS